MFIFKKDKIKNQQKEKEVIINKKQGIKQKEDNHNIIQIDHIIIQLRNIQFIKLYINNQQESHSYYLQNLITIISLIRQITLNIIHFQYQYLNHSRKITQTISITIIISIIKQMNKLQCLLCRQQYNKPHMCPHCSQIYCFQCIRGYLNKYYFCPSCDHHIIQLVDCSRLINEVKQKIKQSDIKKNKQLVNNKQDNNFRLCIQHSLVLKYHCITCKSDICSDCGLISIEHKGHIIEPIQIIGMRNMISCIQLRQIRNKIGCRIQDSRQQQRRYILQLQLLRSQIKYNKTKIYEYYQQLIMRLQKQTSILLKQVQIKISQCNKHINQYIQVRDKLNILEAKQFTVMNNSVKKINNNINKNDINKSNEHMSMINNSIIINNNKLSTNYNKIRLNKQLQKQQQQTTMIQIVDKQLYTYLLQKNYIQHKSHHIKYKSKYKSNLKSKIYNQNYFIKKQSSHNYKQLSKQLQKQSSNSIQQSQIKQSSSLYSHNHPSIIFDKQIYQLGIMKQIYPQYHNFSFQLDYLLLIDQDIVYSPNFKIFGYQWRLKIYPKGNQYIFINDQVMHKHLINIQVCSYNQLIVHRHQQLMYQNNTFLDYNYLILIKQVFDINHYLIGKSVIKQYNSKFSVGECWGYAQFVLIKDVRQYLHDGKLLFVMGVRNVSYYDMCQNMKKYINKLQGQTKILSQLCQNYYIGNNNSLYIGNNNSIQHNNNIINQLGLNSSSSQQQLQQQNNQNYNEHEQNNNNDSSMIVQSIINSVNNNINLRDNNYNGYQDQISSIISSLDDD